MEKKKKETKSSFYNSYIKNHHPLITNFNLFCDGLSKKKKKKNSKACFVLVYLLKVFGDFFLLSISINISTCI